jgi:hypothetical protein
MLKIYSLLIQDVIIEVSMVNLFVPAKVRFQMKCSRGRYAVLQEDYQNITAYFLGI